MSTHEINLGGKIDEGKGEEITVVVEVAGVLDAEGVEDGHRVLLDAAVRRRRGGGGRRARGRHSAGVWAGFRWDSAGEKGCWEGPLPNETVPYPISSGAA